MSFKIHDKTMVSQLNRNLSKNREQEADALSKLATGTVFTKQDPRPSERAIAEKMEFRIRSLSASRKNINDAVSLLQTAESSMSEISNIINRMKEINISAASSTLGDQERRFLFVEYEALYNEINRIALSTTFNSIPLLHGESDLVPEQMIFRVDDPYFAGDDFEDVNAIEFRGLKQVNATTEALGIQSALDLLEDTSDEEGIEIEDVEEMLIPDDDDIFETVYDQALTRLGTQRAIFGAMQQRLNYAMDYNEVFQENIEAAKSKIADTDYAQEVSNLVQAKIGVSATTSLLAQANMDSSLALNLIRTIPN